MAGQEVERIRSLLSELEARQHARNVESGPSGSSFHLLLRKKEASPFTRGGRRVVCELYDAGDVSLAREWARYDKAQARASGTSTQDAPQGFDETAQPDVPRPRPVCSRELPSSAEKTLKAGRSDFSGIEDFDAYLSEASEQAAFDRVCAKLGARERSSHDAVSLLVQEGYSEKEARSAVARAQKCGIVDDARYAQAFVRAKVQAGWGKARIARELGQSRLSLEDCDAGSVAALDDDQELARALAAARKKRISDKNPVEKLARFLAGRGYSLSTALRAAKQAVAESQEDLET